MSQAIQLKNHPFRFLLYLEWGLLAVAIVSALETPHGRKIRHGLEPGARPDFGRGGPPPFPLGLEGGPPPLSPEWAHEPLIAVGLLILFGLMGLYLPMRKLPKLGHTLVQVLLILLASVAVFNSGRTFPAVYLVLVIRSCLMFGLVGRLTMTGIVFVLFLSGLQFRLRSLSGISRRLPERVQYRLQELIMSFQLNFVVLFALSLLLVVLLINALLTERQSQQRLQQANRKLRRSSQEIEKLAMDQERSRIARDIHDTLGHSLTALNIQLESAVKLWDKDPAKAQQFLGNAKRLGSQSLQDVRHSVATLRQDPLAGNSLEGAIATLLQNAQDTSTHLAIAQEIQLTHPLPANLNAILYRIVQEGLTNIVKHAKASRIHLQLVSSPTAVTLTLEDNGSGFNPDQARTGFGLQSMRDRAEATGGTFSITSSATPSQSRTATQGTKLQVSLPIPQLIQNA